MIEWREFNSPECSAGLVGGRKVLEVRSHDRGSGIFLISMFGLAIAERSTFDGAKAKAEELFEEWISASGYTEKPKILLVGSDMEKFHGRGLKPSFIIMDEAAFYIEKKVELPDLSGLFETHSTETKPKKSRRRGQRQQERWW